MRLLTALALGLTALWFGFVENNWLDTRPVQRLLFIGHSRTYYNDMPEMVARMADSAGSPIRYEVTMLAFAGATAKDHWRSQKTQSALASADWDRLILQPDYVWRHHQLESSDLYIYAPKILELGSTRSQPAVISDWTFRDPFYAKYSWNRAEHYEKSQSHYRTLANQTGAQLIDVAGVWEVLRARDRSFSLYKDDDHPTLEGTYLVALVVYAELSGRDPSTVTYVPWGMEGADAELLRKEVSQTLGHRS